MEKGFRKTGIDLIGNASWGTHFCQFYQTPEDLIDILVPYFKAGLENNEFCMWITAEPLNAKKAKASLKKVMKNLDDYIEKGQIKILDYSQWYTKSGKFNADKILDGWVEKEKQALERGFDGLRLTGNTFWLEDKDWRGFTENEEIINNVIGNYKMLAVCSYSLDKCGATGIMDVIANHQFALVKRENRWEIIESSERKRAEEALWESEKKYRGVIENVNEGITVTQDGMLKFVNRKGLEISGYSEEELLSRPFIEFVHLDDQQMVMQHHLKRLKGEEISGVYVLRIIAKDGEIKWLQNNGVIITWEGKPATLSFVTDISERKKIEEALATAKKQWEETFDAVWDWITIVDKNYIILRSNKTSENYVNLSPKQVVGKKCYEIIYGTNSPKPGFPMTRALKSQKRESMEFQLEDGRWILVSVDPFHSQSGDELFVHIVRNITEIKNKENEILFARKAEAFSILAGGIAHDYNNLLSVIWGNISLLREEMTDSIQQECFDEAEKACEQARLLTHKFITLSKGAVLKKSFHSIKNILDSVIKKRTDTKDIEISIDIPDGLPEVELDPELLSIAFKNIILNAVESMPKGGKLEIRVKKEPSAIKDQTGRKYLKISFRDSGIGIPESNLKNLYDPYFTTKELGSQKGMGFGLAVSQSVVRKHGGSIQIASTLGQGVTVVINLPLPDLAIKFQTKIKETASTSQPTILLMEDDSPLRKLCERMLQHSNCEIIATGYGEECIKAFLFAKKNNIKINLLLLDQNIKGGIGGIETLKELHRLGYENKAILITGSPNSPAISDFKKYGFDGNLLKPYTKKELERVVGQFISL